MMQGKRQSAGVTMPHGGDGMVLVHKWRTRLGWTQGRFSHKKQQGREIVGIYFRG